MKLIAVLLTIFCFGYSNSVPVQTDVTSSGLTFLKTFGYLTPPDSRIGQLMSEDAISASLRLLQRFAGIKETGIMDSETKKLIKTPRCGMPDFEPRNKIKRKRRWVHHGSKWQKEDLTWRLSNSNNDGLSDTRVLDTMRRAFKKWSDVTNLNFKEIKTGTPDIWVRFARGYHQDRHPFDGEGQILAHAFYPSDNTDLAGDVHFDDDEYYTLDVPHGKNLLWVAVHELGHSIGSEHSNKRDAIMYPFYHNNHGVRDFPLTEDDIIGIQSLYGSRVSKEKSTPLPKATVKPSISGCTDHIKTVILGKEEKTYIVNRDKLYVVARNLGIENGPLPVENYFKGLKFVDAAFTRHRDKKTVFFSKDKFYVFEGRKLVSGPRKIIDGFSGFPGDFSDISGAFIWPKNDKLYIFKGKNYYRFSQKSRSNDYRMDSNYPRLISSAWNKVPDNIDAVFTWKNGKSYFFKGTKYYRLHNQKAEVEAGYPKSIAKAWFKWSPQRL